MTIKKRKKKLKGYGLNHGHLMQIILIFLIILFQPKLTQTIGTGKVMIIILFSVLCTTIYAFHITKKIHKQRMDYIRGIKKLQLPKEE